MAGRLHLIGLDNHPRLTREMLERVLEGASGFVVADLTAEGKHTRPPGAGPPEALIDQVRLDWLIVSAEPNHELPRPAQTWLARALSLSIMALPTHGADTQVYLKTTERPPHHIMHFLLNEMSLTALVAILRYKYGDAQLPTPLALMRAFQIGGPPHSIA